MLNHHHAQQGTAMVLIISFMLLFSSFSAQATESRDQIERKLEQLQNSSEAELIPKGIERVRAYLGAAMLASDRGDEKAEQQALTRASSAIVEAYGNASFIKDKFSDLLRLQASAKEAEHHVHSGDSDSAKQLPVLIAKGDQGLHEVFKQAGTGKLNASQQKARSVRIAYINAINVAAPILLIKAGQAIKTAGNKNAKRYTPVVFGDAKKAFNNLKRYTDGLDSHVPEHPALALKLAERAIEVSTLVKEWRKESGSHEELLLRSRMQRLDLADALDMDISAPLVDYSSAELLDKVRSLRSEMLAQKKLYEQQKAKKKSDGERELAQAREELLIDQTRMCSEQILTLKDAFRAKLERATFEDKRKKSVQQFFEPGEVEIQANINDSLLLRLSKLKFAPGKTELNPQFFEFLGRVKEALMLYDDRLISINGHTDNQGEAKKNQALSLHRAEAIMDFFIATGVHADRVKALGYGEVRPIASNDFARGREMNRRIDIVIEAPEHDQEGDVPVAVNKTTKE